MVGDEKTCRGLILLGNRCGASPFLCVQPHRQGQLLNSLLCGDLLHARLDCGVFPALGNVLFSWGGYMKNKVDVVIYCPLNEEFEVISPLFSFDADFTELIERVALAGNVGDYRVLVICADEMGPTVTQKVAAKVHEHFEIKLFVCLGICGGISSDLKLGDVCATGVNLDVTNNGKITDSTNSLSPSFFKTTPAISRAFTYFKSHPNLMRAKSDWEASCVKYISDLLPHRVWSEHCGDRPKFYSGSIATGLVSASPKYNKQLKQIDRKMLALETEVSGAFHQFEHDSSLTVMTIRGVSDLADNDKGRIERDSGNGFRRYAAFSAATFLLANLTENRFLMDAVLGQDRPTKSSSTPIEEDAVVRYLEGVDVEAKRRLRLSSPEFRHQPEGYWVPAPRISRIEDADQGVKYLEIADALELDGYLIVQVPFSYPDRGLAHIYTSEICGLSEDGKVYAPVYLDCKSFNVPKTLDRLLLDLDRNILDQISVREDIVPVFVIDNLKIENERIVNHFKLELDRYPSFRCIIVSYESDNADANEYTSRLDQFVYYNVGNVSFYNITKFLKTHFGYESTSAEGLALKLFNAFEDFNLNAHPSYFAGIPKDILQKIVQANRRAELIELAVLGYLTYSVINDDHQIVLSRSTRFRFLSELAVELYVTGKNLSDEEFVDYAQTFLTRLELPVEPEHFARGFFENGIIKISGGYVDFSIPFIKSYIIAKTLSQNLELAKKYFNVSSDVFDFAAFQLYCELTEDDFFAKQVLDLVRADVRDFHNIVGDEVADRRGQVLHALENPDIAPSILRTTEGLKNARKQILQEAENILSCGDESKQKQELLDVSRIVKNRSVEHSRLDKRQSTYQAKLKIVRDWTVALSILGGGSEMLDGQIKRDLAEAIVQLSSLIIDDFYYMVAAEDYEALKVSVYNDITSDAEVMEKIQDADGARKIVNFIVDIMEYGRTEMVLPSIVGRMSQLACSSVLHPTIKAVKPTDNGQDLIRSLWMIGVNTGEGLSQVKDVIKKFPQKAFPRITIGSYLIASAYWSSTSDNDKLNLLAAAEVVVKPLSLTVDKKEVLEEIKNSNKA
jgi:nucleoside phosphorylase